jgi:outer membrane receptor protein involved in Fe transport
MKNRIRTICTLVAILTLFASGFVQAQRLTGRITGDVVDDEGIPLPGVTVEISSPSLLGGVHSQLTSVKGTYRFMNLPPGEYKVVFRMDGFQTIIKENVRVFVDSTVTENIVMNPSAIEETVTVTAKVPVVDITKSGVSTSFGKELIEQLPTGRFTFFDVIKQAPGIMQPNESADSDHTVAFGSNYESNAYQLDGVDFSNPDVGHAWHWVNPEIFQEIQAAGIGAPAEYGNFTGAVINVVTKSGSNRFEGSINYYGQFQGLTDDNNPKDKEFGAGPYEGQTYKQVFENNLGIPANEIFPYNRDEFFDLSFTLGGPLIKDRLWFFGSYEKITDSYTEWLSRSEDTWPYKGDKVFFKLSSQISSKHRLVGYFYYEYFDIPDPITPLYEREATASEIGHAPTWNAVYTFLISNNAYFELKYGGFWSDDDYLPVYTDVNTPGWYDGDTGVSYNGVWWPWTYEISRHQVNANLSYFAEDFLVGDHEFKVGVQYNRGKAEAIGGYAGGRAYYTYTYIYDYYGYEYEYPYIYMYEQNVFGYGGITNSIGAFLDDSWKIGERLTLNFGVRVDHSRATIPPFPVYTDGWTKTGEMTDELKDVIKWTTISPRIGFAYQLTPDQKTILRASYGRYYDAIHMSNWNWPGPGATDYRLYSRLEWEDEWTEDLDYFIPGGMAYTLDPDLKNPYADQFSVGLERELSPNLSIGATFVYKTEKNLIGWEDRGGTYEQVSRISPDNGQTYTVWNFVGDASDHDYWVTQPSRFGETYDQTYKGLMFILNKRYADNWQLQASLTWSRAEGLNTTAHALDQQAMLWYTGYYGRDPNDLVNARGLRNKDRTWVFKLSASYSFPWGILASVNYIYQTGQPIPTFVIIEDLDQGEREILAAPRGESLPAGMKGQERFDAWQMLDFRLQKTFNIYKSAQLHVLFDVFNVLNATTITSYPYNFWYSHSGYDYTSSNYLVPDGILWPRRVQFGARLSF